MQITFAGIIIAQEPTEGGTDAVAGFMPEKKPTLQWAEYLRATDALPLSRMNRKRTLMGKITPTPYATNAAAILAALTWLDGLPDSGALVFQSGISQVTFPNAVLTSLKIMRMGVSIFADLSFAVGPGSAIASDVMTDQNTNPLSDQSGNPLTS